MVIRDRCQILLSTACIWKLVPSVLLDLICCWLEAGKIIIEDKAGSQFTIIISKVVLINGFDDLFRISFCVMWFDLVGSTTECNQNAKNFYLSSQVSCVFNVFGLYVHTTITWFEADILSFALQWRICSVVRSAYAPAPKFNEAAEQAPLLRQLLLSSSLIRPSIVLRLIDRASFDTCYNSENHVL